MGKKMDSVKNPIKGRDDEEFSVNLAQDQQADARRKPVNRKTVSKKKSAPPPQPAVKKIAAKKAMNIKGAKRPSQNVKFMIIMCAVVLATAALAGGGVYTWLKDTVDNEILEARQGAYSTKIDFEDRLRKLKDRLRGIELENNELKSRNQGLQTRADLLVGAEREFKSKDLGFSFEYPAIFGEVDPEIVEDGASKILKGTFSLNEKLAFGSVNEDFVRLGDNAAVSFLESLGFSENDKKYYYRTVENGDVADFEIEPFKVIGTGGGKVLFVDKKSFLVNRGKEKQIVEIGENVGALVNTGNKDFPGVAFMDMDFGQLPLDEFVRMIESVIIY